MKIEVIVNGDGVTADVEPRLLLVEWIRGLGLTGTHVGCDTSTCGACTILVDGAAVKSCAMLAVQSTGTSITTIEGVGAPDSPSLVQRAFMAEHGLQCGFCTPGFVMSVTALLATTPAPTEPELEAALEGNLCRCTGYTNIVRAVHHAAATARGETPDTVAGLAHERPAIRNVVVSGPAQEDLGDTEVV